MAGIIAGVAGVVAGVAAPAAIPAAGVLVRFAIPAVVAGAWASCSSRKAATGAKRASATTDRLDLGGGGDTHHLYLRPPLKVKPAGVVLRPWTKLRGAGMMVTRESYDALPV
jgi:hypothetical protein